MIKEKSQTWAKISKLLGVVFSHLPFSPNCYTWITLPIAAIAMLLIIAQWVALGVTLFIVSGILDLVDGALARHLQQASGRGAFLDGSLDRFIDFMLIFSYFWLPINTPWMPIGQWICLTVFFAIMPSFLVAYANHREAVKDPHETVIWRILNRGEMYVLMLLIPVVSIHSPVWAGYLLMVLVILSAITTLQTLTKTLRISSGGQS